MGLYAELWQYWDLLPNLEYLLHPDDYDEFSQITKAHWHLYIPLFAYVHRRIREHNEHNDRVQVRTFSLLPMPKFKPFFITLNGNSLARQLNGDNWITEVFAVTGHGGDNMLRGAKVFQGEIRTDMFSVRVMYEVDHEQDPDNVWARLIRHRRRARTDDDAAAGEGGVVNVDEDGNDDDDDIEVGADGEIAAADDGTDDEDENSDQDSDFGNDIDIESGYSDDDVPQVWSEDEGEETDSDAGDSDEQSLDDDIEGDATDGELEDDIDAAAYDIENQAQVIEQV